MIRHVGVALAACLLAAVAAAEPPAGDRAPHGLAGCNDTDADGVCDADDSCPHQPGPGDVDSDGDGRGDVCDPCTDLHLTRVGTVRVVVRALTRKRARVRLDLLLEVDGAALDPSRDGLLLWIDTADSAPLDALASLEAMPGAWYLAGPAIFETSGPRRHRWRVELVGPDQSPRTYRVHVDFTSRAPRSAWRALRFRFTHGRHLGQCAEVGYPSGLVCTSGSVRTRCRLD